MKKNALLLLLLLTTVPFSLAKETELNKIKNKTDIMNTTSKKIIEIAPIEVNVGGSALHTMREKSEQKVNELKNKTEQQVEEIKKSVEVVQPSNEVSQKVEEIQKTIDVGGSALHTMQEKSEQKVNELKNKTEQQVEKIKKSVEVVQPSNEVSQKVEEIQKTIDVGGSALHTMQEKSEQKVNELKNKTEQQVEAIKKSVEETSKVKQNLKPLINTNYIPQPSKEVTKKVEEIQKTIEVGGSALHTMQEKSEQKVNELKNKTEQQVEEIKKDIIDTNILPLEPLKDENNEKSLLENNLSLIAKNSTPKEVIMLGELKEEAQMAIDIKLGDTQTTIEEKYGKPDISSTLADGTTIWVYEDAETVTIDSSSAVLNPHMGNTAFNNNIMTAGFGILGARNKGPQPPIDTIRKTTTIKITFDANGVVQSFDTNTKKY